MKKQSDLSVDDQLLRDDGELYVVKQVYPEWSTSQNADVLVARIEHTMHGEVYDVEFNEKTGTYLALQFSPRNWVKRQCLGGYELNEETLEFDIKDDVSFNALKTDLSSIVDDGIIPMSSMINSWLHAFEVTNHSKANILVLSTIFPIKGYRSLLRYLERKK